MNEKRIVLLSCGTNLGNRLENLHQAYIYIEREVGTILKKSSYYESPPWGFESELSFLNTVILVESTFTSKQILQKIKAIERAIGREKKTINGIYADRLIDLDIISCDNEVMIEEGLQLPHPRMHLRKFVLIPLYEIDPDWNHPHLKKSIAELILDCTDKSEIHII